jgi:hypothetical protein
MPSRKTVLEFETDAKKIHGDNRYNYKNVIYINNKIKVSIVCNNCLITFLQTPGQHLKGNGCRNCYNIKKTNTPQLFIAKSILIHGNKYNYDKTIYTGVNNLLIINCSIHGNFEQSANSHLKGRGCRVCWIKKISLNQKQFIDRAYKLHNDKYLYTNTLYTNSHASIIITCKIHGDFTQVANDHLKGAGCLKCAKYNYSKSQIIWLELISKMNNIEIQHAMNIGEYKIPTTTFKADGYCKETNTIYEFHGDYWHGNPKIFVQDSMNKTRNITHGKLYENTLKKEQIIKDLGYNLITIWESDWKNINKSIKILQKNINQNK